MKKQWVFSVLVIVLCLAFGFLQRGEAETQPSKKGEIAFHSNRDGNFEIYVMNADGSEQKRITNNSAFYDCPCWSPDGKRIDFRAVKDENWDIYVMNADGTEQKRLTDHPAQDDKPCWALF